MRSNSVKTETTHITTAKGTNIDKVTATSSNSVKINPTGHFKGSTLSVFKVLVCILILVSLWRLLGGVSPVSFGSFLEYMSNAPVISMPFKFFNDLTIVSDWGLFNFIRDFINLNTGVIGVLVFLATGAINAIQYITYFIRFIFV